MKLEQVLWRWSAAALTVLCWAAAPGLAQSENAASGAALGLGEAAERARIAAQRRDIEAAFVGAQAACAQRFIVTACVDAARERRRAALAPLRDREFELDMAQRAARAAQRREAIERKQRELAAQPPADGPAAGAAAAPAVPRPPAVAAPLVVKPAVDAAAAAAPRVAAPAPREAPDRAGAAAVAAERAAQVREREARIQAAQERVQQRLAEREARGRALAPLPVPAAPASGVGSGN